MQMYLNHKQELALKWAQVGVFLDKRKSPGGRGFKLKLHEKNPDAPLSPFYLNFRLLRSFPRTLQNTALLFKDMCCNMSFDVVADVPTAITPVVAVLSQILDIPMITPRELKTHGSGGGIDGVYKPDMVVALFDDLITKADSKIQAIRALQAESLTPRYLYVLVDREQGGATEIRQTPIVFGTAWTITELLDFYCGAGWITGDVHRECIAYIRS
ncbi:MAG: hypothetical protein HY396_00550 [Candidatus Doudnabacteria bacterium]|nr:hypothetical protein [Candidatus Doudnabacteria bacterium]